MNYTLFHDFSVKSTSTYRVDLAILLVFMDVKNMHGNLELTSVLFK